MGDKKEKLPPKGGNSAEGRLLAQKFYDTTKFKCTPAEFMRAVGNMKYLLDSGYTIQECENAIDWLIKTRPHITNLGYLEKAMNSILIEFESDRIKNEMKEREAQRYIVNTPIEPCTEEPTDNASKFQAKKRSGVKI